MVIRSWREIVKVLVIYIENFQKKCNVLNPSIVQKMYALSFFFRMKGIMSLRCSYPTHSVILDVYEH